MSRAVVVRYRVKPEALDINIRLIRAVYEEMATSRPDGIRYSTYRVDGRTFLHVAVIDGETNPLDDVAAFREFTECIAERCEEGPQTMGGELVGSYSPE